MRQSTSRFLIAALFASISCGGAMSSGPGGTGGQASGSGSGGNGSGGAGSGGARAAGSGGSATGGTTASGGGGQTGSGGLASSGGGGGGVKAGGGGAVGGSGIAGRSGSGEGTAGSGGATAATGGAAASGGAPGAGGASGQPFKGIANSPCDVQTELKISWYYNWTTSPETNCTVAEFVPMISGKNEKTADLVTSGLNGIVKAGYKTVLGFNEPNKSDQSNLTVDQVVSLWPSLTANADIRVGSPATSADGQSWFNDFMTQVQAQSLRVDFIALHWYGWNSGSCDARAANLESYIKWAEGLPGNRPLWLTEWGCMNDSNPDAATVQAFFQGALAMFAKHPRIERYAWYPWNTNNEVADSSDALTPLGTILSDAPSTH